MDYRTIDNDIKSGAVNRAVPILLCGEEPFLIEFYEKRIKELFEANSLDTSVFYGHEIDDGDPGADIDIIGALDTYPMLSPVRVVIVRNHPGLAGKTKAAGSKSSGNSSGNSSNGSDDDNEGSESGSEESYTNDGFDGPITKAKQKKGGSAKSGGLDEYIGNMPDTARLIFASGKINKTRALYKALDKFGVIYNIPRLDEAGLGSFAVKRFRAAGTTISPDVLEAFIYATGYFEKDAGKDLFTVENDANKLALYVSSGGRTDITHTDVEECLPGILHNDVFAILDAASSGRKAESIRLLENALARGEKVFGLLALFTGHFEIMLGYKELNARVKDAR
jgi:DNA polymerase III delta subunit